MNRAAELCYLAAVFSAVTAIWWAWKDQALPTVACGLNGVTFAVLAVLNVLARREP